MQIHRLRLVNFRQHELTELEFGPGLTGIVGPNGAGKTTLLEAIAWVMYGTKAARGGKDSIRRRGAPPRSKVEVEMDFALGPHQFRVVRGLHSAELYQDGGAAPVANSLDAVTERITRLLGMTREEFFNTYFTGQKELAVMAAMSAPERAQFLSRVLGYERIRAAQDRLKERRLTLRARLEALESGIPEPAALAAEERAADARRDAALAAESAGAALLEAADAKLAEIRPRWEAAQQLRERAQALESERRVLETQLRSVREKGAALARQATDAAAARAGLDEMRQRLAALAALRDEVQRLDQQAEAFGAQRTAVAQLAEVRARITTIDDAVARLPQPDALATARARTKELRAELAALTLQVEERRTAWVRDAQDARTRRQGLLDQYQELKDQRHRVMEAGPEGACPTCARPLGKDYESLLGVLDRQLEEVLANGNYFKRRIEQLKDEPPELEELDGRRIRLERELSEAAGEEGRLEARLGERQGLLEDRGRLDARISALEAAAGAAATAYDQARHDEVRRGIRALEPLALQAPRLEVVAEQEESLLAASGEADREGERLGVRIAALATELATLQFTDAAFQALRAAEGSADRERRGAELALVRARGDREGAEEACRSVARRKAEAAERRQEASRVAADLSLHQEVDRALTDLRTDLNQSLRPELSEIASAFVRDLTNGRYTELELDESYMATLLDDGDPKAVISGGEEDIANLALRLAISQMIAERAGQPLSLLVLDEIFGSLDEERRAAVVELLRSLADRFPQVILITHIDSVREGFDRVVRVGYDTARGVAVVRDEPLAGHGVAA